MAAAAAAAPPPLPGPLPDERDVFDDPPVEGDYVERGGLRFVVPYFFDHWAYVKPRWQGCGVVDLFAREFRGRDRAYYEAAFAAGRLRVEETAMTARRCAARAAAAGVAGPPPPGRDAPLRDGQRIRHLVHRHEPPVPPFPVAVLTTSDELVAVCKPPGLPVHPTGQYRKNSVTARLAYEQPGLGRLWPVHRLDRNVSGLLLFARSAAAADALRVRICAGDVVKQYVALVAGDWDQPVGRPVLVEAPLRYDYVTRRTLAGPGAGAKRSATAFVLLARVPAGAEAASGGGGGGAPCGPRSLVAARPLTGRTHQIRAHAAFAGCPVANDAAYGGEGPPPPPAAAAPAPGGAAGAGGADDEDPTPQLGGRHGGPVDALCTHCPWLGPSHQAADQLDCEALFLHALSYSSQPAGWAFAAPLPEWARGLLPPGWVPPDGMWDGLDQKRVRGYAADAAAAAGGGGGGGDDGGG